VHAGDLLFSNQPDKNPLTIGWQPTYESEGLWYGKFLAGQNKALTVAVLRQADTLGQGQMAAVSVYIGWSLVEAGLPVPLAVVLTLLVSLVIGALTGRLLIRRFEGQEPLVAIVATVAVLICFNGADQPRLGRVGAGVHVAVRRRRGVVPRRPGHLG
jgi:branched-subunit amino acid ABC-type transport system permease component